MTEFAAAIAGAVVESLLVPVKKHLGYLFSSKEHVRKLDTRMKQLEGAFEDVKNHKDTNDINTLEVPARVPDWLEEVAKIKSDTDQIISSNENGCFNIKARYQMGRKAWRTTQVIESLLQEGLVFSWTNAQRPLGRVYTRSASTLAPSSGGIGEDFKSRDTTFKDALKFLQHDQNTQVIALCGMGGVGKTTMMEQLKKIVEDKKMFDWIVKVDIGQKPNPLSIQQAVAENLGHSLTETIKTTRANRLQKQFGEILKKGEKRILVILDDVWEMVELKDVGLSPLPNGVKLLLTSRYEDICRKIAVQGNLDLKVLKVNVLEETEAHKFLCQITGISKEYDPELYQIGGEIVKKCSCLPLAIKLIAPTIKSEEKSIWKDRLRCLKKNDLDQGVHEIIKISYDYLREEEDKEIFLLCGLFPEDSNIPIEDLTRYAWGLKLLNEVSSLGDARDRIKACVRNLKNANLLIDSVYSGCVKMHDLVRAFVSDTNSKGDHASIINHGDSTKWSGEDMSESCKRLSLTCMGMREFPQGFKCPNISLLKLMHGDDSFKFSQGFFENTGKLKVIAYEKMKYPLLPRSFQLCSTNIRTLCLHECSLMFDISFIGDLSNLEVLSITECNIRKLSSAIGNLKELRVLDLTGCVDLFIDDGVLKRLVKLEELYMLVSNERAIRFTDANVDELVGCSKNLTALAIEFNVLPMNIWFKKLERFKISLGCNFDGVNDQSRYKFENTLKLVTDKCELLDSRMNQLYEKVEVLHLQVNGVTDLEDSLAEPLHHHHHRSSFNHLRVLEICKCADLTYLFTVGMANGLMKLERLTISFCPVLETVIDGNKGGVRGIKLQALKFLCLEDLPKLESLCNVVDVIELPNLLELQLDGLPKFTSIYPATTSSSMSSNISERKSFLNEEVVIPKLEILCIYNMENLKEVWPCELSSKDEVNVSILRVIYVYRCERVVNLFPSNPMSLLHHLEDLIVEDCGSIEVLFNIDLGCVDKSEEISCCLRRINVRGLMNLREVWMIKGANYDGLAFSGFQAIESLEIRYCKRFRNVFTPTTTNFDMPSLTRLEIGCEEIGSGDELVKSNHEQEIHLAFPSYQTNTFHNLHTLRMNYCREVEVVFKMETPSCRELAITLQNTQQPQILPYLKDLRLVDMERMSHVWKCNWNEILILQKQQPKESFSSFHNLTTVTINRCNNIEYLFNSPIIVKLLSNLKEISIWNCDVIKAVSNGNEEDEKRIASMSSLFPHLRLLNLHRLPNLKRIDGGSDAKVGSKEISSTNSIHNQYKLPQVNDVAWSLCQYVKEIKISYCQTLSYVIPSYALTQMQKLEHLYVDNCESLMEVFETQGFNIDEGSGGNAATMVIPIMKITNVPQLSNLKKLVISDCDLLQYVFTFSTLESLRQLEVLRVINCKTMKVIVKEDNGEKTTLSSKVVLFPRLKCIELRDLPKLAGFFLGMDEFQWPLLDFVMIDACPQMMAFTSGRSIAPKVNYIHTKLGKYSLEYGLSFPVMAAALHESLFSSLDTTNSRATTSEGTPWSFHNLIEVDVKYHEDYNHDLKNIIPSNELLQLQKLEKIHVEEIYRIEEVFEVLERTDSSELQSVVVEVPMLREVELKVLENLKYMWKNNPWMVLEFPNLTKLSIRCCKSLEHVFTSSMVGSLMQLQDLHIHYCRKIEVIVKEANVVEKEGECDEIIMLPRLKSLRLEELPNLEGFCLGKKDFSWPSLDTLEIIDCPAIRVFTNGNLSTPELKVIDTSFGRCELVREEDLNSFINTAQQEGLFFGVKR